MTRRIYPFPSHDLSDLIRIDGRDYPVGRTIKNYLREEYGVEKKVSKKINKETGKFYVSSVSYPIKGKMLEVSKKEIEKQEEVHEKARQINKDPYEYEKQVKNQRLTNMEKRILMKTRSIKGEL